MNTIDPRLQKLANTLNKATYDKSSVTSDTEKSLWPDYTFDEIQDNDSIYKEPIATTPHISAIEGIRSLKSKQVPQDIIDSLVLLDITFRGFNNKIYPGQTLVHKDLEDSIITIFNRILAETDFPMTCVLPISIFNWKSSKIHNNTGAFDWRFVKNTNEVSDHAFGAAIDINPVLNPWVRKGLPNSPNHPYDETKKGTLHAASDVVKIFKEEGWKWGGDWKKSKDWMHFYRPEIAYNYYGKIEEEE